MQTRRFLEAPDFLEDRRPGNLGPGSDFFAKLRLVIVMEPIKFYIVAFLAKFCVDLRSSIVQNERLEHDINQNLDCAFRLLT